jgi:hypothetical protein
MSLTAKALQELLSPIAAAYSNWKPTAQTYRVYGFILGDLDEHALKIAVWRAVSEDRAFAPAPGELRALALDAIEQASGSAVPSEFEAWQVVSRAFIDVGHTGEPDFPELISEAVRRVGGWRSLCASENATADRSRFIEAYRELRTRKVDNLRLPAAVKQQYAALTLRLSSPARPSLLPGATDASPDTATPSPR